MFLFMKLERNPNRSTAEILCPFDVIRSFPQNLHLIRLDKHSTTHPHWPLLISTVPLIIDQYKAGIFPELEFSANMYCT